MKCLTCNECKDKGICAKANGLDNIPFPLVEYQIKLCMVPSVLHYIKDLQRQSEMLKDILSSHTKEFAETNRPEMR